MVSRIGLCAAVLALAACGERVPAAERGRLLLSSATFSSSPTNVFSCVTCHDVDSVATVARFHWWGGSYDVLLDAVNECLVSFMRGRRLSPDDEDGRALLAHLESITHSALEPVLPLTVVTDIVDLPKGNAARGAETYAAACERCHGAPHTGAGRIADWISVIPDSTLLTFGSDPKTGARAVTIEKVRHGKFFNIGGVMPLYSLEALPDAHLADILSYLGLEP
jgi:thiosulfate dehydrogenase